ncbi:hypothetical protein EXS65_02880 [Candidatus Peribacteria bacterium]|nr:hypothetical protein [Candidatus Peribacteria bacterium]
MLLSLLRALLPGKKPITAFAPDTLPWLDRPDAISQIKRKRVAEEISEEEATMLNHWRTEGFVALRSAVEEPLIDALWRDEERAWRERPACKILSEGVGVTMLADSKPKESLTHHHYRMMDFHNLSEAGAKIMMHPTIVRTLTLLFGEPIIAMQSLLFEYGSEQHLHQDFPYVHAEIPSHLIGGWVACEPADAENGSLLYYPGSHRIPLFDFGDGSVLYKHDDPKKIDAFEAYLQEQCSRLQKPLILDAKKGDVLLWHGSLVHGGSLTQKKERTRRSFVTHYSTKRAYTKDRRSYDKTPIEIQLNGGTYHAWQFPGHEEGRYKL